MNENWKEHPLETTGPVIGTGNFLGDRGYADSKETRVKFQLANQIALHIEDRKLRQSEVSQMTGLVQSDVSKIVNGNISGFSVWRLLETLNDLGENVTISVQPAEPAGNRTLAMSLR